MKITKITLHNYRAFYGTHSIDIGSKNLLIYGENGSGKSSLYKGLDSFFRAASNYESDKIKTWEHNIFLATDEEKEKVFIKLEVNGIDEPIELAKPDEILTGENVQFVREANKIRGFLDYRRLLKTHLSADNAEVNLFDMLVNEMLWHIPNRFYKIKPNMPLGEIWEAIEYEVHEVRQGVNVVDWIETTIEQFNEGFNLLLTEILQNTQTFLSYFVGNTNIEISFDFRGLTYIGRRQIEGNEVFLTVKLNGQQIPHQEFLNEARLSALSISLYLAAVKNNPSATNSIKLLFLDDIFIGLDMSNRLPLLAILKDHFADYQIFMTTYDRNWYEVAKDWFERKAKDQWAFFEMYVDNITHNFDVPVIIENKTHLEKAEYYLLKHDYPACGMYLRKECEKVLSNLLKPAYRIKDVTLSDKAQNYLTEQKRLNDLIVNFKDFCQQEAIDYTDFEDLGIYKDALLNPLSHNDIDSPIFKAELLTIIAILHKLKQINIEEVPNTQGKDALFIFNDTYSAEIKLTEKVLLLHQNGQRRLINVCKVLLKSTRKNGIEKRYNESFDSLQEVYTFLCNEFGLTCNLEDISKHLEFRGKKLQDMITEI